MRFEKKTFKKKGMSVLMIIVFFLASYASIAYLHVGSIINGFQLKPNFANNMQNETIPTYYIGEDLSFGFKSNATNIQVVIHDNNSGAVVTTQMLESSSLTKNITFSLNSSQFSGGQIYTVNILAKQNTPLPGIGIYDSHKFSFQVVAEPSALVATAIYEPMTDVFNITANLVGDTSHIPPIANRPIELSVLSSEQKWVPIDTQITNITGCAQFSLPRTQLNVASTVNDTIRNDTVQFIQYSVQFKGDNDFKNSSTSKLIYFGVQNMGSANNINRNTLNNSNSVGNPNKLYGKIQVVASPSRIVRYQSTTITSNIANNTVHYTGHVSFLVQINHEWQKIGTSPIVNNSASFSYYVNLPQDHYRIQAEWFINNQTSPLGTAKNWIEVLEESLTETMIFQKPNPVEFSDNVNLGFTLLNPDGNPIPNRNTSFFVYVNNTWQELGSVLTDHNGLAQMKIPIYLKPALYDLKIDFVGGKQEGIGEYVFSDALNVTKMPVYFNGVFSLPGRYSESYTFNFSILTDNGQSLIRGLSRNESIFSVLSNNQTGENMYYTNIPWNGSTGGISFNTTISLTPGNCSFMAFFPGNEYYTPVQNKWSFTILKEMTQLLFTDPPSNFTDNSSKFLQDEYANLTSTFPNFTLENNTLNASYFMEVEQWESQTAASLQNSSKTAAFHAIHELQTLKDAPVIYSQNKTFVAVLIDRNGNPLPYCNLSVTLNGTYVFNMTTGLSGQAEYNWTANLPPGNYVAQCRFLSTSDYIGSQNSFRQQILICPTILTTSDYTLKHGENTNLIAQLTTNSNAYINGQTILFKCILEDNPENNFTIGSAITNQMGLATLNWNVNVSGGYYSLQVSFLGNNYFSESDSIGALTIEQAYSTSLSLSLPTNSVAYDHSFTIHATLTALSTQGTNVPLCNQKVLFYIGSKYLGYRLTNSIGQAVITISAIYDSNTYKIKAIFNGATISKTQIYQASAKMGYITIIPEDTFLYASIPSEVQSSTFSFSLSLKNDLGKYISGQTLSINYYDTSGKYQTKYVTTSSNGETQVTIQDLQLGTNSITINYQGDNSRFKTAESITKIVSVSMGQNFSFKEYTNSKNQRYTYIEGTFDDFRVDMGLIAYYILWIVPVDNFFISIYGPSNSEWTIPGIGGIPGAVVTPTFNLLPSFDWELFVAVVGFVIYLWYAIGNILHSIHEDFSKTIFNKICLDLLLESFLWGLSSFPIALLWNSVWENTYSIKDFVHVFGPIYGWIVTLLQALVSAGFSIIQSGFEFLNPINLASFYQWMYLIVDLSLTFSSLGAYAPTVFWFSMAILLEFAIALFIGNIF